MRKQLRITLIRSQQLFNTLIKLITIQLLRLIRLMEYMGKLYLMMQRMRLRSLNLKGINWFLTA